MQEYEIKETKVEMIGIELEKPFPLGFGVLHALPRVFYVIEAESKDGIPLKGIGEASIDFPFSHYDAYDVYDALQRVDIKGEKLTDREKLLNSSENRDKLLDFTPAAFCAFNMALDDIVGKSEDKSVVDLYGRQRESLRVMSSLGFYDNTDVLIKEIIERTQRGYLSKVKLGKSVAEDLFLLDTLSNELPQDITFAVDFNAQYSSEEVEEFLFKLFSGNSTFNPKRVFLWEQPTKECLGIKALKQFRDKLKEYDPDVMVLADESFLDIEDAIHCSENGIGLNYKIHKIGGLYIAKEIEKKLEERNLLTKNSLVGGTFPTAIGRVYDRQAGVSLKSTSLPSDGMEPSTNWFKNEKHFIRENFPEPDNEGKVTAHEGQGSGVSIEFDKIEKFLVKNPKEEYQKIRKGRNGSRISIKLKERESYGERYREITGKAPEWNLK